MGVTVGEVEAVLSARDIMSPVMIAAAERVKSLETQLKALGSTSGATFTDLNARLQSAQANFDSLAQLNAGAVQAALARTQAGLQQTSVNAQALGTNVGAVNAALGATPAVANAASATVNSVAQSAAAGGQSMNQMEGIAMRLIERMLILYAIRGTFNFVVGLVEGADALVKMSTATDMSLRKLQELQIGADAVGVPFTKVTTAIDFFGKKLAEQKMVTQDALESIHLSFAKIFALNPEDRLEAVIHAIGDMPDKLERTKVEVALFGTDAIDPLVKNFDKLKAAADSSNKVMSDSTLRTLSAVDQGYKDFFANVKGAASATYATLVGVASMMASIILEQSKIGGQPQNIPDTHRDDFNNLPRDQVKLATADLKDYIDRLREAAHGENDLTQEQVKQLMELKELNLLTEDNAAKLTKNGISIGLNTEQYKKFTQALKDLADMDKAAERYAQAWERAEKEVAVLWEKDIEAQNARERAKAANEDAIAKDREQRELTENEDRLKRGQQTDKAFFANKAAIEYTYWQQHNDTLKHNEQFELNQLTNKMNEELAKVEERYAQGLIDENQYQQERAAIAERFANQRLTIEDQFNVEMDIRRRKELDKEIQDQKDAAAKIAAARKKEFEDFFAMFSNANQPNGGSTGKVTRANLEKMAEMFGVDPLAAFEMATRGFSFDEIIEAWRAGMVKDWVPHGPRIEGFAEGGMVDIKTGERGPEVVRVPLGSQVATSGTSMGGSVEVKVYVNGVLDPLTIRVLTDALSAEIIKRVKLSSQFGSR